MVQGKADIMDNLKDWTGNVFMCEPMRVTTG
jgi:hypothetical protein